MVYCLILPLVLFFICFEALSFGAKKLGIIISSYSNGLFIIMKSFSLSPVLILALESTLLLLIWLI